MKVGSVLAVFMVGFLVGLMPAEAIAGNCLSHPESFRLQSDAVEWSFVIARGQECIQGLRGKTMIFESVSMAENPKTGRVVVQGPSFRYFAGPEVGTDSFKFVVVGSSMRMSGTSTITVNVEVR